MSNVSKKEADNAIKAYVKAVESHNRLLDKYFPGRQVIPGVESETGEPITVEVLKKFEEAVARVTETHQKWDESLRRLSVFQKQSP